MQYLSQKFPTDFSGISSPFSGILQQKARWHIGPILMEADFPYPRLPPKRVHCEMLPLCPAMLQKGLSQNANCKKIATFKS